jgi:serine/threonine protein kinase
MHDLTNTTFNRYRLLRLLGRGASANVYLGEHIYLKAYVAIKILQTRLSEKESESFRNEAHFITRLKHPNIVNAHSYDVEDGIPFIVMDYAPNGTLRQRYPGGTRLSNAEIVRYVMQVADALQYAHDRERLIHRDVKPANMLLGPNNEVWLSDFGVSIVMPTSRSLTLQEMAGTVWYMAPEQAQGKPCLASDQYALGVVVYEWLCGSRPFTGTFAEIPMQHMFAPPPSLCAKIPTISPAVEEIVFRALAKDPQQRFPSVRAFADELKAVLGYSPYTTVVDASMPASSAPASDSWLPTSSELPEPTDKLPVPSVLVKPLPDTIPSLLVSLPTQAKPITRLVYRQPAQVSQPPPRRSRRISRRSALVGLAGLTVVLGSGIAAFEQLRERTFPANALHSSSAGSQSARPAASPSTPEKRNTPAPTPGAIYTYRGHTQSVKGVLWLSNQHIASGSLDGTVRIWDASTGADIGRYAQQNAEVKTVASSPDSKYIASGDINGKIHVWDAATGQDRFSPLYDGQAKAVRSIAWSPDGRYLAAGSDDSLVSIWDAQGGSQVFSYAGHSGSVLGVAWSPGNGAYIASGSDDHTIQIWSATNKEQRALLTYRDHSLRVWSVAWSPDGTRIVSASQDGTVQVWNARTASLIARHLVPSGKAEAVAWSPDGQWIAGGCDDGTVQVWNAVTGQLKLSYRQQSRTIWSLAWSPDGRRIASASDDGTVQVWQVGLF